ncbi:MAG: archease [Paracoccaceae bacterium]|nr:archease [Paracoccaceae bacterium]
MESVGRENEDFVLFPHDADVGVRGYGRVPAEAFANAARAMTAAITPLGRIAPSEAVEVSCSAPDMEVLFVDWLNAVIFEMATRRMLFSAFDLSIEDAELRGTLSGEAVDVRRHAPSVEPKGATFTGLSVKRDSDGRWVAECIVDV